MRTQCTRWITSRSVRVACGAVLIAAVEPATVGPAHPVALLAQSPTRPLSFDRFGARFLASVVDEDGDDANVVFSPVSAGLTLSLALLGARGSTARALVHVLGEPSLDRQTLEQRGGRTVALLGGRTDVQLDINTAIWVDGAVQLSRSFAASAATWGATTSTLSLSSPGARDAINRWAERSTHGRIRSILPEPLTPSTRLLLTNAVYFKGRWADGFDAGVTGPRDFTLVSGRRIRVPAMERTGQVGYRRASGFQVVRLPYRGDRTAMYVILPDSGVAVRTLIQRFAAEGWATTRAGLAERDVHLVLPKFHVEDGLDLRPSLEKMGGAIAFDCDGADFSDLAVTRSAVARLPLCMEKAVQTVYLDVNEEGTEAAAITGMSLVVTAAPPPPMDVIVDRPFLFVLHDDPSGTDLFVGIIRRPTS